MTYVRDPHDTDEPPCFCGHQAPGPVLTTEEFCPACGDPGKPVAEPEGDGEAYTGEMGPCACPCHDDTRSPICMTCCDGR